MADPTTGSELAERGRIGPPWRDVVILLVAVSVLLAIGVVWAIYLV